MAPFDTGSWKRHTAITFLQAPLTSVNLAAALFTFFNPAPTLPRCSPSSSATHFHPLKRSEGQRLKVKREVIFSHSYPRFTQRRYRCRVSLEREAREENHTHTHTPNCSLLCANGRLKHSLLLHLCTVFFQSTEGLLGVDSNSSCHLLSYGWGVGVWGENSDTPDTAGRNED